MLGRIHGIRHRQVTACRVAEGIVVIEYSHHVFVTEERPLQVIAESHRTTIAHFVISSDLIIQNALRAGVPILLIRMAHDISSR